MRMSDEKKFASNRAGTKGSAEMFEKTESRREMKYNFDMILIETSHKFIITQPFFLRNIFSLIFANLKELLFLALFFACILADTLFACLLPHRIRRFFQFFRTLCFVVSRVSFLDYPLLGFFSISCPLVFGAFSILSFSSSSFECFSLWSCLCQDLTLKFINL